MKSIFLVSLISFASSASLFTMNFKDKMSSDFLTGFESGIFLRNNTAQFDEYGCPDQETDSEEIRIFKSGLDPIKTISKAMGPNSK